MSIDTLVSAREAARMAGMGTSSLYRLAKSGRVRSYAAGPRLTGVRFSITELLDDLRRPGFEPHHGKVTVEINPIKDRENKNPRRFGSVRLSPVPFGLTVWASGLSR